MKVRVREPRVARLKRNGSYCPCCDHLTWKHKLMDQQALKEALEEISNTLDCEAV
jgi:hypothetical protein